MPNIMLGIVCVEMDKGVFPLDYFVTYQSNRHIRKNVQNMMGLSYWAIMGYHEPFPRFFCICNPLQHLRLENLMDRGTWQATVYGSQRVRHD